jgi:CDP-diglyceride synthetase
MTYEPFIDEPSAKSVVSKTFIGVAVVLLAMVLTFLLIWSYQKSTKLFIMFFSVIVLVFCVMMVVFVTTTRSKLTEQTFTIYLSAAVFMTFLSIIMVIIFTIFAVNALKKSSELARSQAVSYTPPIVPRPLETYNQQPITRGYPSF